MADAVKVTPPLPATKVPPVRDGTAEDVKSRRLDWKLNAEELSLIRREEERVMKPAVLRKLLAAGAALECACLEHIRGRTSYNEPRSDRALR